MSKQKENEPVLNAAKERLKNIEAWGKAAETSALNRVVANFMYGVGKKAHFVQEGQEWKNISDVIKKPKHGIKKNEQADMMLMRGKSISAIIEIKAQKTGMYAPLGQVLRNAEGTRYSGHWTGDTSREPEPSPRAKGVDLSNTEEGRAHGSSTKPQLETFLKMWKPAFSSVVSNIGPRVSAVQFNTVRELIRFSGATADSGKQNQKTKPDIAMSAITMMMRYAQPETKLEKTSGGAMRLKTGSGKYIYTTDGIHFQERKGRAQPGDILDAAERANKQGVYGVALGGIAFMVGGGKTIAEQMKNVRKQLEASPVAREAALSMWRSEDYRISHKITTQGVMERPKETERGQEPMYTRGMTATEYKTATSREKGIVSVVNILGKGGMFDIYNRMKTPLTDASGRLTVSALPFGKPPRQFYGIGQKRRPKPVVVRANPHSAGYVRSRPTRQ